MLPRSSAEQLDWIERQLGKPAHRGENYAIYSGDCLEYMGRLGEGLIDLTVTSPPYNIGKEYESIRNLSDYLSWCERWIREIHRITNPDGAFWLNLGYLSVSGKAKALPIPYLLWDRTPFFLVQEIVWHYGAGVAAKTSFSPRNEKFLWYVKDESHYTFNLDAVRDPDVKYPKQKKNGKLKCNPLGKNPSDVWMFPKVTSGTDRSSQERTAHPAQFPIAVIDRIIKSCSQEGDLVFDPFLGSGSTIEAALGNGRMAIGFEIEPSYISIAVRRIEKFLACRKSEMAQASLF
jgi:adenine-specific DNA-methyltransferase